MHRRFRQVFTSLKEHTSVSYAKIATIGGFCDLDLVLVKATSPDDFPLLERYIHEIIKTFSISPPSYHAFALAFARRFSRTQCWRVALKCMILLHRLLRALPDENPLRTEILFVRSNGILSLDPCHFRDSSSSSSDDYTSFIRSYARLLDEAIDCSSLTYKETYEEDDEDNEVGLTNLPHKMKEMGEVLEILPQIQSLINRVMDCQPTGAAARSFLVHSVMKYIVRDSFIWYTTFRKEIVEVLDNLIQMPYRCSITAFGLYKKAATQASKLCKFYDWCKSMGLCGIYEYPFVDRIPNIQIEALENFLHGLWQLTDSSSSTSSTMRSPSSSKEEDEYKFQMVVFENYALKEKGNVLKKEEEMEPFIKFDDEVDGEVNNVSWEVLLEASVLPSLVVSKNYFFFGQQQQPPPSSNDQSLQIYNPYAINPFQQQYSLI